MVTIKPFIWLVPCLFSSFRSLELQVHFRHPYPTINIHYRYRFRAPYSENYEISSVEFSTEKLENFNWNYLDHYICTHGEGDFELTESLKYMRFRIFVLPASVAGTKKILEGSSNCDVYGDTDEDHQPAEDFLKFLEVLNKIRRPVSSKKTRVSV